MLFQIGLLNTVWYNWRHGSTLAGWKYQRSIADVEIQHTISNNDPDIENPTEFSWIFAHREPSTPLAQIRCNAKDTKKAKHIIFIQNFGLLPFKAISIKSIALFSLSEKSKFTQFYIQDPNYLHDT